MHGGKECSSLLIPSLLCRIRQNISWILYSFFDTNMTFMDISYDKKSMVMTRVVYGNSKDSYPVRGGLLNRQHPLAEDDSLFPPPSLSTHFVNLPNVCQPIYRLYCSQAPHDRVSRYASTCVMTILYSFIMAWGIELTMNPPEGITAGNGYTRRYLFKRQV